MSDENKEGDLLKRLQKALHREGEDVSLEETGGDNVKVVSIRRKPAGEPTLYMGDDFVLEWKEKFAREEQGIFPPFRPGEKVTVPGVVEKDPDGLYKIHVDADGRYADNFFIGGVPEPDPLKSHIGMPLDVLVSVGEERKNDYRLSDIWNYDAELVEVVSRPFVNPTPEETEKSKGKRVIIEGTFLGYEESPADTFLERLGFPEGSRIVGEATHHSNGHSSGDLSIETPDGKTVSRSFECLPEGYNKNETAGLVEIDDGRVFSINMSTGKTVFSDGVLENIRHKVMLKGDKVRISAYVNDESDELQATWCSPCYLDKPLEQRQNEYDALRSLASSSTESIAQTIDEKKYKTARQLISMLRALELTAEELDNFRELTLSIPKNERPVQSPKSRSNPTGARHFWVESIDDAYETGLESMTKPEFIDFARSAVTGERKQTGKHADTSYLFWIAEDFKVDTETRESLIVDCIESRLSRIRGIPYDHDKHFDDKYNINQAFKYLASIGTETSAQRLFDYMHSFIENREFHEIGWKESRENRPETFLNGVADAIAAYLDKMPDNVLLGNLGKLKEAAAVLETQAEERFTRFTLDNIRGVIAYTVDKFGDV